MAQAKPLFPDLFPEPTNLGKPPDLFDMLGAGRAPTKDQQALNRDRERQALVMSAAQATDQWLSGPEWRNASSARKEQLVEDYRQTKWPVVRAQFTGDPDLEMALEQTILGRLRGELDRAKQEAGEGGGLGQLAAGAFHLAGSLPKGLANTLDTGLNLFERHVADPLFRLFDSEEQKADPNYQRYMRDQLYDQQNRGGALKAFASSDSPGTSPINADVQQRQAELAAENDGSQFWATLKHAWESPSTLPAMMLQQGVATALPSIAAGMGGAAAGTAVGGPAGAAVGGTLGVLAGGAATVSAFDAQELIELMHAIPDEDLMVLPEARNLKAAHPTWGPREIRGEMIATGLPGTELRGAILGAATGLLGPEAMIARVGPWGYVLNRLASTGQGRGLLQRLASTTKGRVGLGMAAAAGEEYGEEALEKINVNYGQREATGDPSRDLFEGVGDAGAMGALLGLPLGAFGGYTHRTAPASTTPGDGQDMTLGADLGAADLFSSIRSDFTGAPWSGPGAYPSTDPMFAGAEFNPAGAGQYVLQGFGSGAAPETAPAEKSGTAPKGTGPKSIAAPPDPGYVYNAVDGTITNAAGNRYFRNEQGVWKYSGAKGNGAYKVGPRLSAALDAFEAQKQAEVAAENPFENLTRLVAAGDHSRAVQVFRDLFESAGPEAQAVALSSLENNMRAEAAPSGRQAEAEAQLAAFRAALAAAADPAGALDQAAEIGAELEAGLTDPNPAPGTVQPVWDDEEAVFVYRGAEYYQTDEGFWYDANTNAEVTDPAVIQALNKALNENPNPAPEAGPAPVETDPAGQEATNGQVQTQEKVTAGEETLVDRLVRAGRGRAQAELEAPLIEVFNRTVNQLRGTDRNWLDEVEITSTDSLADVMGKMEQAANDKTRVAEVVAIDPAGIPVDWRDTRELAKWLRRQYQGVTVEIADDGTIQQFTRAGLDASAKRRGEVQRQAYAGLDRLLQKSLFDSFELADEDHRGKVAGQNIYYAAAKVGEKMYSVRFKIDIPLSEGAKPAYKDHRVSEIEIAPSLYRGPTEGLATQDENAISRVSLAVLKRDVKPSRIEGDTLYQPVLHVSPADNLTEFNFDYLSSGVGGQWFGLGFYATELRNLAISKMYKGMINRRINHGSRDGEWKFRDFRLVQKPGWEDFESSVDIIYPDGRRSPYGGDDYYRPTLTRPILDKSKVDESIAHLLRAVFKENENKLAEIPASDTKARLAYWLDSAREALREEAEISKKIMGRHVDDNLSYYLERLTPDSLTVAKEPAVPSSVSEAKIYQLNVPKNEELLDWFAPWSSQSEQVKDSLRALYAMRFGENIESVSVRKRIAGHPSNVKLRQASNKAYSVEPTAEQIYIDITTQLTGEEPDRPSDLSKEAQFETVKLLTAYGIPGNRHAVRNSRYDDTKKKSYHFVIWDTSRATGFTKTLYQKILQPEYTLSVKELRNTINATQVKKQDKATAGQSEARAAYQRLVNGQRRIILTPQADASSGIHEFTHGVVDEFLDLLQNNKVVPSLRAALEADVNTLVAWGSDGRLQTWRELDEAR
ncbi:MAG: hypothetical protein LBV21_01155, partial [Candidatus Adiutrix sp.]|nr:hypothetical protein [Candidatus Adiutrix sp.]